MLLDVSQPPSRERGFRRRDRETSKRFRKPVSCVVLTCDYCIQGSDLQQLTLVSDAFVSQKESSPNILLGASHKSLLEAERIKPPGASLGAVSGSF